MNSILDDQLLPNLERKGFIRTLGIIRLIGTLYYAFRILMFLGRKVTNEQLFQAKNIDGAHSLGTIAGIILFMLPIYYCSIQSYWELRTDKKRFAKRRFRRLTFFIYSMIIFMSIYNCIQHELLNKFQIIESIVYVLFMLLLIVVVIADFWYEAKRIRSGQK